MIHFHLDLKYCTKGSIYGMITSLEKKKDKKKKNRHKAFI